MEAERALVPLAAAGCTSLARRAEQEEEVLDRALSWARERDYRGFSKFDGLESPVLRLVLGFHPWTRLLASQLVMRAPVNVRPLLGIPQARNPKGIALFAGALLLRYRLRGDPHDRR